MDKKYLCMLLAVALAGGMIGGALSVRVFSGKPALADEEGGVRASLSGDKEITAQKIVLLDDRGRTRAIIGMFNPDAISYREESSFLSDTQPGMALFDDDGRRRAYFGLFPNKRGGYGYFNDMDDLSYRCTITDYRDSEASLLQEVREGNKLQMSLSVGKDEKPSLSLLDKEGNRIWSSDQPAPKSEPLKVP